MVHDDVSVSTQHEQSGLDCRGWFGVGGLGFERPRGASWVDRAFFRFVDGNKGRSPKTTFAIMFAILIKYYNNFFHK